MAQLIVLIGLCLIISFPISAQRLGVIEKTFTGQSDAASVIQAKKEIMDKAAHDVSAAVIVEMIGEDKYRKNVNLIETRIIRSSGKFIPYIKVSEPSTIPSGVEMTVSLKLSLDNLQTLLREQGLLYENDGPPIFLPLIVVYDMGNKSGRWWMYRGESDGNSKLPQILEQAFFDRLARKGFYSHQPIKYDYGYLLSESLKEQPNLTELQNLASYFSAQILISGEVRLEKGTEIGTALVTTQLRAQQSVNNRLVAELNRSFTLTELGPQGAFLEKKWKQQAEVIATDLIVQIQEAWQRGTLGASQVKLIINSPVSYVQYRQLLDLIPKRNREIKVIRERFFAPDQLVFELDYSGDVATLASSLEGMALENLKSKVQSYEPGRVILTLKSQ